MHLKLMFQVTLTLSQQKSKKINLQPNRKDKALGLLNKNKNNKMKISKSNDIWICYVIFFDYFINHTIDNWKLLLLFENVKFFQLYLSNNIE